METVRGAACRLVHGSAGPAVGADRVRLETALLDRARERGVAVHEGAVVSGVRLEGPGSHAEVDVSALGGTRTWTARLIVGADGPRSLVARSARVASRRAPIRRVGLSVHHREVRAVRGSHPVPARLVLGDGWYCGLSPVPGRRVNVGIVMAQSEFRHELKSAPRPEAVVERVLARTPLADDWRVGPRTDEVTLAVPLAHRVHRVAGPRFVLVGDAAGFVDPVSGEGLHRAFLSAARASEAVERWRRGDSSALTDYDSELRRRYRTKDAISWLLQLFMTRPFLLDYAVRRLDRRERVRRTFAMVMSDLAPPERALDPRFLAALLAP